MIAIKISIYPRDVSTTAYYLLVHCLVSYQVGHLLRWYQKVEHISTRLIVVRIESHYSTPTLVRTALEPAKSVHSAWMVGFLRGFQCKHSNRS